MNVQVLFTLDRHTDEERSICTKYFFTSSSRMLLGTKSLVVGRYSVLPYYKELEEDLRFVESSLINTYAQHNYVADMLNYVEDLAEMTPQTWAKLEDVPFLEKGSFVLKGTTNSKKFLWHTHMFAENRSKAVQVMLNLMQDSLVGMQPIRVRRYVPLRTYDIGAGGYPIAREFRFFVLDGHVLSGGFYWANFYEDLLEKYAEELSPESVPQDFLQEAIQRVQDKVRFFAIDVAQKQDGSWTVIELNDGQMSGLCMNDADTLYRNMSRLLAIPSTKGE